MTPSRTRLNIQFQIPIGAAHHHANGGRWCTRQLNCNKKPINITSWWTRFRLNVCDTHDNVGTIQSANRFQIPPENLQRKKESQHVSSCPPHPANIQVSPDMINELCWSHLSLIKNLKKKINKSIKYNEYPCWLCDAHWNRSAIFTADWAPAMAAANAG